MTVRFMVGDALSQLAKLPNESVHCVVTSPPYWGLRAYKGDPGMIGLEPTFDEHLENLVAVFREVRRVLRSDGTLWLNYGDVYASAPNGRSAADTKAAGNDDRTFRDKPINNVQGFWKPKDLLMMPARVAIALQADGWWLRSEIIWHKPNPMPESCKDRPTSAHDKMFLLTKSARYFYDAEAVRENSTGRHLFSGDARSGSVPGQGPDKGKKTEDNGSANLRNVWTIATHAYSEAHFATFPPALVEPCIKAGTSAKGVCGECGAPLVRDVALTRLDESRPQTRRAMELARKHGLTAHHIEAIRSTGVTDAGKARTTQTGTDKNTERVKALAAEAKEALGGYFREFLLMRPETTGWSPSCDHDTPRVQATVLDPFAGSGTVGLVADRLQRDAILIEISPEYAEMARRRIADDAGLLFGAVGE